MKKRISIAIAGLGLLGLAASATLAPSAASAPAAAPEPVLASLSIPADEVQKPASLGCWVTGEMVSGPEGGTTGDPAAVALAFCKGS